MTELVVQHLWNGEANPRPDLWARFALSKTAEGLLVTATMPTTLAERIPNAPENTRVDNLWEYSVAELFLAKNDKEYLEIEIGPCGHYLVLGFKDVRVRSNEYKDFAPTIVTHNDQSVLTHTFLIPTALLPNPITRACAFVISGDVFLSSAPLPGEEPNFHQPSHFPPINF